MITFKVIKKAALILIKNEGNTSIEECIAFSKQLPDEASFSYKYDILQDNRQLESVYTSDEIERIIGHTIGRYPNSPPTKIKNAIVADKEVLFGISRMYEMLNSFEKGVPTAMVFRNMDEAFKWLGRNPNDVICKEPFNNFVYK